MIYVLAPNQTVEKYPYSLTDLRLDNPDVSFSFDITNEEAATFNTFPVLETPQPIYNQITQTIKWENPILKNNEWVQQWAVVDLDPEQIAYNKDQAKAANKAQAESLLRATDWTATVDINDPQYSNPYLSNQPEFLAYRSDVRKIAVNPPITVDVWPTIPEEVWVTVPAN